MWVRFTQDFNWTPANDRRRTTGYRVGHQVPITRACAKAAAGKFEKIPTPRRDQLPVNAPADRL